MTRAHLVSVSLAEVDLGDETFRCSFARTIEALERSIARFGLICPPKVQPRAGRFRVISGFLRIEAARRRGMQKASMTVVEEDAPDEALFLKALEENRFCRGFNWAEHAMVLKRVGGGRQTSRSWVLHCVMPALGLHPSEKLLEDHLRCADIPDDAKRVMVRHGCSRANALRLTRWPLEHQPAIISLLEKLHLGENVLRECLERMHEVWLRDGTSPRDFLAEPGCRSVLNDPDRSRPQKTQGFRAYLRRRRFPSIAAVEEAFQQARARLALGPGVSLHAGPYFEEEGIRIAFRARTPQELKALAERLREAAGRDEAVQDLFDAAKMDE
jgi:hypothetical protein